MNNKTEIDFLNYDDLNLVEEKIKECTDRANEAMSPQINKIIDGKSTQETRSGKNLFKPIATAIRDGMVFKNNGDGSYSLNGTATRNTSFYVTGLNYKIGTYTLSLNNSVVISNGGFYAQMETSAGYIKTTFDAINAHRTATTKASITALSIVIKSGVTLNNFIFKPQLEEGSTITSFEPYGVMPSPDYPSEIENVKGKNLLKPTLKTTTLNGITCTANKDGTYTLNGTATADTAFNVGTDVNLTVGKTYKAVGCPNGGSATKYRMDWNFHGYEYGNGIRSKKTSEIRYVQIKIFKGVTVSNLIFKPMFTENTSSTYNDYVPYGNIQIVETGKNLLNLPDGTYTNNGVTATVKDGIVTINGTATANSFINIPFNYTFLANTNYTLSANNTLTMSGENYIRFNYGTTVYLPCILSHEKSKYTKNFNENTIVNLFVIRTENGKTYNNFVIKPQLEKGSTATDYEPYTEEVVNIDLKGNELCSLPNGTKDELIVKDGRAKIVKRIGKVVLDGSENWRSVTTLAGNRFYLVKYDAIVPPVPRIPTILSNNFSYVTPGDSWAQNIIGISLNIGSASGQILIKYNTSDTDNVTKFKNWLSTHNTIAQYELREPYEIDLGPLEVYFTYETKKWKINELPYIQEIDRIEKGIYNLGEKYNRPKGWLTTKEWITKDNLYPIKGFDYRDWNRWVNNLNLFTTDIVLKDTIWNGASFINWEQIGKDEWR